MTVIPRDMAIQICEQLQEKRKKKFYSIGEYQCQACQQTAKGDPSKMCFATRNDNRGCIYINKMFDKGNYY